MKSIKYWGHLILSSSVLWATMASGTEEWFQNATIREQVKELNDLSKDALMNAYAEFEHITQTQDFTATKEALLRIYPDSADQEFIKNSFPRNPIAKIEKIETDANQVMTVHLKDYGKIVFEPINPLLGIFKVNGHIVQPDAYSSIHDFTTSLEQFFKQNTGRHPAQANPFANPQILQATPAAATVAAPAAAAAAGGTAAAGTGGAAAGSAGMAFPPVLIVLALVAAVLGADWWLAQKNKGTCKAKLETVKDRLSQKLNDCQNPPCPNCFAPTANRILNNMEGLVGSIKWDKYISDGCANVIENKEFGVKSYLKINYGSCIKAPDLKMLCGIASKLETCLNKYDKKDKDDKDTDKKTAASTSTKPAAKTASKAHTPVKKPVRTTRHY